MTTKHFKAFLIGSSHMLYIRKKKEDTIISEIYDMISVICYKLLYTRDTISFIKDMDSIFIFDTHEHYGWNRLIDYILTSYRMDFIVQYTINFEDFKFEHKYESDSEYESESEFESKNLDPKLEALFLITDRSVPIFVMISDDESQLKKCGYYNRYKSLRYKDIV